MGQLSQGVGEEAHAVSCLSDEVGGSSKAAGGSDETLGGLAGVLHAGPSAGTAVAR